MRSDNPTRGLPVASPAHMLPVEVIRREVIAPDVVSVFIVLPGTEQAPAPYLPGQFVTLALPTPRETLYRSYSLCGDGDASHPWELTIKRVEMGAVSSYFYASVHEGTLLYASLPRGTFTLPVDLGPESLLVMVAMGSGITPIMGMLRALDQLSPHERPLVQLHYASKSPRDIIFGDELERMDPEQTWLQQYHYLSSQRRRMTVDAILSRTQRLGNPAKAHWYMCGADALKRELQSELAELRVASAHVHSEVFATQAGSQQGPAYRVAQRPGAGEPAAIHIVETDDTLDVQPNETLLGALERQGYRPNFSCRVGACGACRLRILEGEVDAVGEALTPGERADGYVLSCIAHPIGDVVLLSGGQPPTGVARVTAVRAASGMRSPAAVALTRLASVAGIGAMLLGAWNLTDHRPSAWSATVPSGQLTPALGAGTPSATATATPGVTAQATSTPSGSGTTAPPVRVAPTPTPVRVAPAPTPTVCTSTSTHKCP